MACHYVRKVAKCLCGVTVCADVDVNTAASGGIALGSGFAKLPEKLLQGFHIVVAGVESPFLREVVRAAHERVVVNTVLQQTGAAAVCAVLRDGKAIVPKMSMGYFVVEK